jgi:hypothetical protein
VEPATTGRLGACKAQLPTVHSMPQFEQFSTDAPSLRERPVLNIDAPPVNTAAVAFPPLMPFFFTRSVSLRLLSGSEDTPTWLVS